MTPTKLARWLPHLWSTSQLPPKKPCNWFRVAYKMCEKDITLEDLRVLFIAIKKKKLTSPEWLVAKNGKYQNWQRIVKEKVVKIND